MRRLLLIVLALAGFAGAAKAQTLSPNPDLDLRRNGRVNSVAALGGGQFLVGGTFQRVSDTPRTSLARLNADGGLDAAFTVDTDGEVRKILVSGGFAYVQGNFTTVGGVARNGLARIVLATGQVDPAWDAALANRAALKDMAVDSAGNLIVVGTAMAVGGLASVDIAKLAMANGLADAGFAATVQATFAPLFVAVVPTAGGAIYVIAQREVLGDPQNVRILKLNGVDGSTVAGWNPDLNAIDFLNIFGLAAAANGDLYVAGDSIRFAGTGPSLMRLDAATGAVPVGWGGTAGSASHTRAIALGSDGVYAVQSSPNGDSPRLAKFDLLTGDASVGFAPQVPAGQFVLGATLLPTAGGLLVGGEFAYYGNTRVGSIFRVGSGDALLDPGFASRVQRAGIAASATWQADGKVVIGGNFNFQGGAPLDNLLRLNADGSVDGTWAGGANGHVSLVKDVAGSLFIAGTFESVGNSARKFAAKLDAATGALVAAWAPTFDVRYQNITGDATSLYAIGGFRFVNGVSRLCMVKLDATTGAVDAGWTSPVLDSPEGTTCGNAIELAGAKVYAGLVTGLVNVNGQGRRLVRLDPATGAVDGSFDSGVPFSSVNRLFVLGNSLYAAGSASNFAGVATRVGRFSLSTGAVDAAFRVALPAGTSPAAIFASAQGLYVGLTSSATNALGEFIVNYSLVRRQLTTGATDDAFAPTFGASVAFAGMALAPLSGNRVLVASAFEIAGGSPRRAAAAFAGQVVPGSPTGLVAVASPGQVTLTFVAPASDGGSGITQYTATCGSQSASGSGTTIIVSGLPGGVPVTCTVTATNAIGTGAPSAASAAVTPAAALFRAYLSRNGSDANPCTLLAPCRLLPAALNAVAARGEIWMLDSANFNASPVTIAKSVTILAVPGALGSIVANSGDALVIQGSLTAEVTLRNLVILNLAGTTNTGVQFAEGVQLTVEGCEIYGMSIGIRVLASGSLVNIKETTIRDVSQKAFHANIGSISVLDRVDLLNNVVGVEVSQGAQVEIRESFVSGNFDGLTLNSFLLGAVSRLMVVDTVVSANTIGLDQSSIRPTDVIQVVLSGAVFTNNTSAVTTSGPGTMQVFTRGDNVFRFNVADFTGVVPQSLPAR